MPIEKVGVVGCGLMGSGIAQIAAQAGCTVFVREVSEERLNKGLQSIEKSLGKFVEKGTLSAADRDAAAAAYRQAIAIARDQEARWLELRAATSLARLWAENGKRDAARELLAPTYQWFTEGFDKPDLRDAKALLDELA